MSSAYQVMVDWVDIYNEEPDMQLISPRLELELGGASSFDFTLPPGHIHYHRPRLFLSNIEVFEYGESVFYGRATSEEIDFYRQRTIKCEGALAFLNDTHTDSTHGKDVYYYPPDLFRAILGWHNSQVGDPRKIYPGKVDERYVSNELIGEWNTIPISDPFNFDYMTCKEAMSSLLLNRYGGYFNVRRANGVTYMDWVKDLANLPNNTNQTLIQYGINLSDIKQTLDVSDFATQILPLGKEVATPEIWSVKSDDWTDFNSEHELEEGKYEVDYEWGREHGNDVIKKYIVKIWDDDIYTTPRPDNYDESGEPSTIRGVNNGDITVAASIEAVASYGPITTVQTFSDISTREELKARAIAYLSDKQWDRLNLELKAEDLAGSLNALGASEPFQLGQMIHVVSTPQFIDKNMPISKISFDISKHAKNITLGTLAHQTLTTYTAKDAEENKINKYKKTKTTVTPTTNPTSPGSGSSGGINNYNPGGGSNQGGETVVTDGWTHIVTSVNGYQNSNRSSNTIYFIT